jgi:CubicO group peptidase (beta-lactamase class C family)
VSSLPSELARIARLRQAERRLPSLSVAAFRRGEVLWQEAYGLADAERGAAATPDTQYRVGSITKTFTAVAIMQLRDAGELALADTLGDHLPESPHAAPTIRQLLAHLSGLQREPPGEVWESLEDPAIEELLGRLPDAERVLEPGAYWHYSNLAYALLGEIVARRSGMPATRYLDERVLGPLGLTRTTWLPSEPYARGYLVEPYSDAVRPEVLVELRGSAPIGQLWSTTGDLARWGAFLLDGEPGVLERRTAEEMRAVQGLATYVKGWRVGWGLGLQLSRDGDRILVGHGGAMPGFLAHVAAAAEDGIGAVALTNSGAGALADAIVLELARRTFELEPSDPEAWAPAAAPPAEVAGLLGRWWSEGTEYVFRWRQGRLEAAPAEGADRYEPTVFEPDAADRYRPVSGIERGELLRVVRDGDGEPVKLYWATYPFTRSPRPFGS